MMKEMVKDLVQINMQTCSKSSLINSILIDDSKDNELIMQLQQSIKNKWSIIKRKRFKDAIPILIDDIQERMGTSIEDYQELLNFKSPFYTDILLSRI